MNTLNTCRFCSDVVDYDDPDHCGKLKYAARHYAHFGCYLDHKGLTGLTAWQIGIIPRRSLEARGLLERANEFTGDLVRALEQIASKAKG
jgi:hypothetical protein